MYVILIFELFFFVFFVVNIFAKENNKNNENTNVYQDKEVLEFFNKWRNMTEEEKDKYVEEFKNNAFDIKDF